MIGQSTGMPLIYLDTCCFNRPFDDLLQDRVRLECEAVLSIIAHGEQGKVILLGSDILVDEISNIPHPIKRLKVLQLYRATTDHIEINDHIILRAEALMGMTSLLAFDALHLASAEYVNATALLTTDKKFLNNAARCDTPIKVKNPITWLMEVNGDA